MGWRKEGEDGGVWGGRRREVRWMEDGEYGVCGVEGERRGGMCGGREEGVSARGGGRKGIEG